MQGGGSTVSHLSFVPRNPRMSMSSSSGSCSTPCAWGAAGRRLQAACWRWEAMEATVTVVLSGCRLKGSGEVTGGAGCLPRSRLVVPRSRQMLGDAGCPMPLTVESCWMLQ